MEPIQLEPMAVIQAQRDRIKALTDENVQLSAAVTMLQKQVQVARDVATEAEMAAHGNGEVDGGASLIKSVDVTDEVARAEITA